MDNTKRHQARIEAEELKKSHMIPLAKFREEDSVVLENHQGQRAIVLEVKFNRLPWMHSYVVSPEGSDELLEVMEWGISQ